MKLTNRFSLSSFSLLLHVECNYLSVIQVFQQLWYHLSIGIRLKHKATLLLEIQNRRRTSYTPVLHKQSGTTYQKFLDILVVGDDSVVNNYKLWERVQKSTRERERRREGERE